ncbi:PREDICTED: glutamate-rich protein 1 isoform X2 [Propithecus coquereli]|uniref:glutamate-rich protein 1 isoform X2 n=1 Tax=Propithecus coquereli TaxID=379532 RepID=UPI00063F4331|nr:PREDICTED: glutamate-rich protein 1 isoform X2 [Propithecus coquereli]
MAARRRHVFVEKVLQRLFPDVPSGREKREPQTPAAHNPPRDVSREVVRAKPVQPLTDGDTEVRSGRRIYTVSLPPEGYVPCVPEPDSCTNSENISSSDDSEDQDLHHQPKRRRVRKRKSKKNPSSVRGERAELEKQQSLLQEKSQPPHADGPTISKNKKRKLKKKQQIKRKKAAGLATKASGVSFTYQPEGSGSDLDTGDADGEEVTGTLEGGVTDSSEEDVKVTSEKTDSILNFLKSTQEIYFYDDPDAAVCVETSEELLTHLASHSLPPSDVFILDHMKTLLLLQDTERLKTALEVFPEHCTLPPDHARVISAFFNYWITNILPENNSE